MDAAAMYCFYCGTKDLKIILENPKINLNCGGCQGFLGYFDAAYYLAYCQGCNVYSVAYGCIIDHGEKKRYKLNKVESQVVCLIDDVSNNSVSIKPALNNMIKNAFLVKDLCDADVSKIYYFSPDKTSDYELV